MWSRRFLWTGIGSSALTALCALVLIWLALGLPIWFRWRLDFWSGFLFPVVVRGSVFRFGLLGLLAFPFAWYWLIFRARSYEPRKLFQLVFGAYALSWIAIFVGYYPIILRDRLAVRGQFGQSVLEVALASLHQSFSIAVSGAALLVILYTVTALPFAALQRALLLRFFRPDARS